MPLGQSDDALYCWRTGNVVTVDYLRQKDGFYIGGSGSVVKLGAMPSGLRPRHDIRQLIQVYGQAKINVYVTAFDFD